MDVGGFWRSPKKVIIEDSPCHFYPSRNRSVQGKNPTKTPPSLSYHHAPQIQVLGERPVNFMHGGNSSFWVSHRLEWFWTVFLCIVMWSASNKKHPSVSYFSQQCDLTFQVWSSILPQVWGIFPFFFGSTVNVLQNATWWARPMAGGRGRRFESQKYESEKTVFFPFRWREVHLTNDIKLVENGWIWQSTRLKISREVDILRSQRHRKSQKIHGGQRGRHLSR